MNQVIIITMAFEKMVKISPIIHLSLDGTRVSQQLAFTSGQSY